MATNQHFMQALPADFEQLAFETGAFSRARKIKNPTQLMKLIMLYCGQDLSCAVVLDSSPMHMVHSVIWG